MTLKEFFSQNNADLSRRVFTKAGLHPFDQFLWSKRDISIKNDTTGQVVFSGSQYEFPADWSDTACQIVGEKYFRVVEQPDGSKIKETSVKQMVNRVVDTIVKWGEKFDYFGESKINKEVFSDELKYMLVGQYFSFNSPVWFNVGTKGGEVGKEQVSACLGYDSAVYTNKGILKIGDLVRVASVDPSFLDGLETWDSLGK